VLTGMIRRNISCIITVEFYFLRFSLLLIELSEGVNEGSWFLMVLLAEFIPCGRNIRSLCTPYSVGNEAVLLLKLCTKIL
jgi:hypothetical protein